MYQTIYVPVDNSDHSNRAIATSLALARAYDSKLTGSHVYAARMHDYRFHQMEFTLPEEYLEEGELSRQRRIHDSLITMGLELISDCYLTDMDKQCQELGVPFVKRMMDGKHSTEILKDIGTGEYDLVVIGALGMGRTRDAQLGSVAERVAKHSGRDVWVVKHLPKDDEPERDTILVGVDGSPQSFGALQTAFDLAKRFGKKVEMIAVYDPYLHYAVFKGIVGVLTDKAAKVFRFEEQNQLHEEIIDTGLAEIYQSHLNVAETMAAEEGLEVTKTLLDGKCFQKVLDHARKTDPWLLVVGRVGIHREDDETGLGSNTDNILRMAPCDVLLTTAVHTPELDVKAEKSIHWTPEAEARMERAPETVRGIARTAILRMALEKGHSVVTSDLVTEAMDRYMPGYTAKKTEELAEKLALERARTGKVSICRNCSAVAMVPDPVRCTRCGGTEFSKITRELVDQIETAEGGADEEITYDGRKLRWTQESRKALKVLTDPYQRRRAKARIEKAARSARVDTISVELAQRFIEEEGGVLYETAKQDTQTDTTAKPAEKAEETPGGTAQEAPSEAVPSAAAIAGEEEGMKILARDRTGAPLLSRWDWTEKAIERVLRVPKGFMRDRTQKRIEELASEAGASEVTFELVEQGIEHGLQMMKEMIAGAAAQKQAAEEAAAAPAPEVCPVAHDEPKASAPAEAEPKGLPLNEVSVMSELEKERRGLDEADA